MVDQDWKLGAKYRFKTGLLSEHLTPMVSGSLCMHLALIEAFSEECQRRSLIKTISLYLFIFILSVISGLKGWLTGSPEPM